MLIRLFNYLASLRRIFKLSSHFIIQISNYFNLRSKTRAQETLLGSKPFGFDMLLTKLV